jgi:carnitine-CoA ligase
MPELARGTESLSHVLARWALERPDAIFMVFEDEAGDVIELTYAEIHSRAGRAARALIERGVTAGDRVHLHLPNCPEFFDWWFGAATIGAVIVPTNPVLVADELAYVVGHARCGLTVTNRALLATAEQVQARGRIALIDEARPEEPEPLTPAAGASDLAAVLYTSGTTSRPKGVLVTNANYLYAGDVVAQHLRVRPDDRWLIVLPLFHANAQYYSTMSALVSGASVAVMSRFSASRWGRQSTRHGATLASLFAAPIRMILAQPECAGDANNELRAVVFSQNVTEEQTEQFERRFGAPLLQLYGMTETIAPPLLNPLFGERRNMSLGRPTLGARLRVVDASGTDVEPGSTGELLVAGEPGRTLMAGYLDDEAATLAVLRDGWLHTGDNVRVDADGFVHFVDRARDMIKRAGENIAAGEIEAVANAHPAVFEAAAVGIPDPVRDEGIKLFVVTTAELSEEDLLSWCRERLAPFKVPSLVAFVDALPRTSVGKVRKEVLRGSGN